MKLNNDNKTKKTKIMSHPSFSLNTVYRVKFNSDNFILKKQKFYQGCYPIPSHQDNFWQIRADCAVNFSRLIYF